ncbi:MAG: SbcC/MukB-like Walker B domain-containing protein, partial [Chromatiaceae bacterium]
AFLGSHREALLVDPAQVREAIGLYRREGKRLAIHGSRVINTLKTAQWRGPASPGSLAEMAISDDPHAAAYIIQRAGKILRVETEDELLRHERAITADGMLASGSAVLRLAPVEPMLGREARWLRLQALKAEFDRDQGAHYRKQEEKAAIKDLRERQLMPLHERLRSFPDLVGLTATRQETQVELDRLQTQEQALRDDTHYLRLQEEVKRCATERDALAVAREQTARDQGYRILTRQVEEASLATLAGASQAVVARRRALQQTTGFDAALASERLDELQSQEPCAEDNPAAWQALSTEAARRAGSQEKTAIKQRTNAREGLTNYWAAWSPDHKPAGDAADDPLVLAAWVVQELTQVRETQLARYVTEADNALREAEHAFRSDFVGKLQENLQLLEESRKELNRSLRSRPFHSQYYSFIKQPEPDLKEILDWVLAWTPEQGGDVGGLFDAARDPNHPHRAAIARVRNLLMEAAGGEGHAGGWDKRLADYRQYYHFDVRMSDDKEGGGNPELLSRRLGKGSGGEHQSPFYVAIGAALAAAYRLERDQDGHLRGGLALAVFDEAFSKLDLQNTVSALGFLDELGLQVLLAAPDEKYGQIAEHVDTIVNVYRDGGSVHIDTEYIQPAARRALGADNPTVRLDLGQGAPAFLKSPNLLQPLTP